MTEAEQAPFIDDKKPELAPAFSWAKKLHLELGDELVRRWNLHDEMVEEIGRLRDALANKSER